MAKYLKMNSKKGYIEDTAVIAHEKFNNMRHVIFGCMLGDFDNTGKYIVRPEIVNELISMDKYIIESIDNIEICESFLKLDKPITFAITFQNDKATLSLLEKMSYGANYKLNSGSYSDINEYILAEVETSGLVDKNVIYRMWNVKPAGGSALDVFHMDAETLAKYAGVVRRFKYLLVANKKLLQKEERIEEIESAYFNKMMKLLARYPKLKVAVEKEIKNQLDEKTGMLRLDKPNFMKTMNEIVADAIEDNIELLDEKEKKTFEAERHNVENEYNIEITKEIDISAEKIEQKDLNADPIVVPVIETFDEGKSVEELAKEFVEEEKDVEKRVQDDMVTLATGKEVANETKTTEKEESKNLIVESIKGEDNKEKNEEKDTEKNNQISDFQRSVLSEANKDKNRTKNERLDAMKGIIAIATETKQENIVITPKGIAAITEENKKLVVAEVKDGKVTKAVSVSQKQTDLVLKNLTGEKTQLKIQETQAQVVVADNKTNENAVEKQTENKKGLVVAAGNSNNKDKDKTTKKTNDKSGDKSTKKKGSETKVKKESAKEKGVTGTSSQVKSPGGYFPVTIAQNQVEEDEIEMAGGDIDIEVIDGATNAIGQNINAENIDSQSFNAEYTGIFGQNVDEESVDAGYQEVSVGQGIDAEYIDAQDVDAGYPGVSFEDETKVL